MDDAILFELTPTESCQKRLTRTANNKFGITVDTSNWQDFILSTIDVINLFDVPNDSIGQFMPPSYSKEVNVYSLIGTNPMTAYAGWLVKEPRFDKKKKTWTQEFIWDEWISGIAYVYSISSHFPLMETLETKINKQLQTITRIK